MSTTTAPGTTARGYENFLGSATAPTVIGVRGNLRRDEIDTVTSLDPICRRAGNAANGACRPACATAMSKPRSTTGTSPMATTVAAWFQQDDPGRRRHLRAESRSQPLRQRRRGYETPTLGEMAYSAGGTGFNLGLKPSTSTQYEFGAKAFVGDYTRLNVAVSRSIRMTKSSRPAPPVAAPITPMRPRPCARA